MAFVSFENESDCAAALKAHTQIGDEKVNVSYAFAKAPAADSNKNQEKKGTTPSESPNKKQQQPKKPGLSRISLF